MKQNLLSQHSIGISFFIVLVLSSVHLEAQQSKWMTVGALQSWYSSSGSEIEEGRVQVQQDGVRWPAIFQNQDMIAAKAIWIGTTNYLDKDGTTFQQKVVHVGPRVRGNTEFFPTRFKMISKLDPPAVFVDGNVSQGQAVDNDSVDASLKADRVIDNIINTSIGVEVHRKIIGFSQQGHDNYLIYEYTFTNTGKVDDIGTTRPSKTLTGVYFYWQNRYAVNADTRYIVGNSTGWGTNTLNDVVGDSTAPHTFPFAASPFNSANDLRATYAWHGKSPAFSGGYDNIGGSIWVPYYKYQSGDTIGRLGATQFVGLVTLYAQKSPSDTSDDKKQPATTSYEGSDESNNSNNDQYNAVKMSSEYSWMSKGHVIPRHADKVGPTNDPAAGSAGAAGYSAAIGYGPYTLAPGERVKIVMAEAAGGLSREANTDIGRLYKNAPSATRETALLNYKGVSKTKNDWVYTGRDSLFKTFRNAINNYQSGYVTGSQAPFPPKFFNANSGAGGIRFTWELYSSTGVQGFQVWRAISRYDSNYTKIADLPASARAYQDTTAVVDVAHYYNFVVIGANGLTSNPYYAQTYDPVYKKVAASAELVKSNIRIVPNPYNISAAKLLYPGEQDKIAFKNVPAICTIRIYSELGELINTLEHNDGTGTQDYDMTTSSKQIIVSGIYIAVVETPSGSRAILKFVVIR